MKKYLIYLAVLAVVFASCEKNTPFDTQSPDDEPLILKPYNESGTGSFTYNLGNPDTPLFDSVTVTPSNYTTVNWYLNGLLVFTGLKIEMTFPTGSYELIIEAVTTAGKRTERKGSVTVSPYDTDPYSATPAAGRHCVPGNPTTLEGSNLTQVDKVLLTKDIFGKEVVNTITPEVGATDTQLAIVLPETQDGRYYVRFKNAEGKIFGAGDINVHNASVALSGYSEFVPGTEWTITGVKLENVASVKLDETVITELTKTATSITFTAPNAEVGDHKLSIKNADGSSVYFITADGLVETVTAMVSAETTIWEGSCVINWGDSKVELTTEMMKDVPVGSTIYVYFNVPDAEYHALRITDDWWSHDLLPQVDGMEGKPNPYTFVYDEAGKEAVDQTGKALVTGFGLEITKISFK
ncbi:MAG: IPT/TIG domain-containing protein [Paludibacteraceae bacterium]|nr:IPT/TIG domain-containing protein [Paludibacteraceae bacterium]